ncbi:hypothetical protein HWI92_13250 [Dyadobacter sandarakinus]|uniref:Uncharacterized protein n=2 Tax=Dyadobacter sandarakinus TaxID=2747268 RepID=A0ABX7IF66_9BACT|nr:hypothetical protein HWI92_13250 [Dyadobacter sandarakinus]
MIPVFIAGAVLVMGAVVRFLWNAVLPDAVNAHPITYWQAVGLLALCRILFGGFGGRPAGPPRWGKWGNRNGMEGGFGGPFRNKWMHMTDEERQRFKQEMRRRCGGKPPENR